MLSFPRPSTNVLTETSVPRVVAKLVDGKEVAVMSNEWSNVISLLAKFGLVAASNVL